MPKNNIFITRIQFDVQQSVNEIISVLYIKSQTHNV